MGIFKFTARTLVSFGSIGLGCLFTYYIYLQYQAQTVLLTTTSWTATVELYIYCLVMAWMGVGCVVYGMMRNDIRKNKHTLK